MSCVKPKENAILEIQYDTGMKAEVKPNFRTPPSYAIFHQRLTRWDDLRYVMINSKVVSTIYIRV
jgi:hypothetical protein